MKRKTRSKLETVTVGNIMVKIYEHVRDAANGKTRTDYLIPDYTAGKRRLRWFSDRSEARAEAEKIARQLSTGETTAATMRNADAASYGRAIELLRPTGVSLELAAAHFAEAFKILGGDQLIEAAKFYIKHGGHKLASKPVADAVLDLLAVMESKGKSERYIGDLRARLSKFAVKFGANSSVISEPDKKDESGNDSRNRGVDISTITTSDVQHWLDSLKVAEQTTKNFRTVLNRLFAFAESRGYIAKGCNPVEDTETIEAKGGEIEIYTPDEIAKLLAAASPDFLPCLAIQAFAGLRSAEVERLNWENIDLTARHIVLGTSQTKTASRRLIPISNNLLKWLLPYLEKRGSVWTGGHDAFYDAQQDTAEDASVKWKANALRHSFVSYRLAETQDAAKTSLEAGNSPQMVFKHYRELVRPADAVKWFNVLPDTPANVTPMAPAASAN